MKQEIDRWIAAHEEEMVADIRKLVEIPSISQKGKDSCLFGEACFRAARQMQEIAQGYGLETEDCGGRCIRIRYGTGEKRIEIWNHLDVVPEGKGWVHEPYGCERIGDFLIGRGVSDNKGPAIAVLYAIRYLKEKGIPLHYALSQVCGLSEETGMEDAAWYVARYGSPDFAMISDCRFPLCYGEKGRCLVEVRSLEPLEHVAGLQAGTVANSVAGSAEVTLRNQLPEAVPQNQPGTMMPETKWGEVALRAEGIAGHAAAPEKCVNPIGILAGQVENQKGLVLSEAEQKLFQFLKAACSDGYGEGLGIGRHDAVFGKMSCAGTVLKLEEGKAVLTFDIRFPPDVNIRQVVDELGDKALQYGLEVARWEHTKGYQQSLDSEYVRILLQSYDKVCGRKEMPYVMGGNTYARFFENAAGFGPGIPKDFSGLNLPPGHGGGHACDEVQSVSSLCTAVKIYIEALQNLDNTIGGNSHDIGIHV